MSDSPDQLDQHDISNVLDQSEIDRLMSDASKEPEVIVLSPEGQRYPGTRKLAIDNYDFRNPVFLGESEMRQVRICHEQFVFYLSARLSMFLHMDFELKLSKLSTAPYSKFIESIPSPTFISLFEFNQLKGTGILEVNPRLAMTIVDRMLGGKGHSIREERYLTELEMALMEDVVRVVLDEWCRQWGEPGEITANVVGHENN